MSLDARIQQIARAAVDDALVGSGPQHAGTPDAGLQQEVRDLHEHLHRALTLIDHLAARVEALESPAPPEEQAPARTARRKTGGAQS